MFAYWFGHASGDWLWEFPALTAPALGFLGLAGGLGRSVVERPKLAGGARNALTAACAAAVLASAVSLVLPWVAEKEVEAAGSTWRDDPPAAFSRLERASRLNPIDDRPDLVAGAIASRLGDWPRMRSSFERALARNPKSWYAELEVALAHALEGRNREALLHLRRAQELNPTEPTVRIVQSQIRAGRPIVPAAIDRLLLDRAEERTD
jgi:tetratricopeptide (TPR) repeat protein